MKATSNYREYVLHKNWMDTNRFKMYASKTEYIYIYLGSSHQLAKFKIESRDVSGELVERTDVIKYLGPTGMNHNEVEQCTNIEEHKDN